jgi:protein TonB
MLLAFAVSLAVHALLLSLQFRMPEAKPAKDRGLEVVLVNTRHAKAPPQAELRAQANVDGGGSSEQPARPKSPLPPQATQRDGDALVEARRRTQEPVREQKQVITREKKSPARIASAPKKIEQTQPEPQISGLDLLDSAAAVARIEAEIDRNLDEIAKRPRKKFIGARTKEYRFAQYVEDWRLKVERVGTLNYPEAARGRVYGSLLLSVTIRADGTVEKVSVHRSSGHALLDEAAVRIVKLAAPYAPFPPAIRKDTDIIEITRTWAFTNADQVRTN